MDINKYLELPTSSFLSKPKYMKYLETILHPVVELGSANDSFRLAFDIQNAAGKQLDILGELVGVGRLLPFAPLLGTREMSDEEYRIYILLKVFRNEWDGTIQSAVEYYQKAAQMIGVIQFYDSGECNVAVTIHTQEGTRLAEIIKDELLIPTGVSKLISVVDNEVLIEFGCATKVVGIMSSEKAITYSTT